VEFPGRGRPFLLLPAAASPLPPLFPPSFQQAHPPLFHWGKTGFSRQRQRGFSDVPPGTSFFFGLFSAYFSRIQGQVLFPGTPAPGLKAGPGLRRLLRPFFLFLTSPSPPAARFLAGGHVPNWVFLLMDCSKRAGGLPPWCSFPFDYRKFRSFFPKTTRFPRGCLLFFGSPLVFWTRIIPRHARGPFFLSHSGRIFSLLLQFLPPLDSPSSLWIWHFLRDGFSFSHSESCPSPLGNV